ncbi:MAG: DUF86 domain-containing protein [Desulfobacterales bacterium]|jgi:uncharacterized protein YutE (UPF0331/DUF86 family)
MLDRTIIETHLDNMEAALANLRRYQHLTLEEFTKDLSYTWIAAKGLEILIQNLLDIGAHLLASEIKNDWDDYGEIIFKLGLHGIIPKPYAEKIQGMAGLRNILVHEYLRIDLNKLHEFMQNQLADFTDFMAYIQDYLDKKAEL